jgi:hypothetical protein
VSTEWIRKNINPKLVARYEREMFKLRGETSSVDHIVDNINKMNEDSDQIESDTELHARALAEDEEDEKFFRNNRSRSDQ